MLHYVVCIDRSGGAAQRHPRECDSECKAAIFIEPVGDHEGRGNDRRCGHSDAEQDEDQKKFKRRIRAAEGDVTKRDHRCAPDHHLARVDSIHQPPGSRTAHAGSERPHADEQREKSAAPSEVRDYRDEEYATGVERSPDQEQGRE